MWALKKKSTKVRCDYNSRSSTRNSSVNCKRFEMPKRRCDYNSFQSHNERYGIAPEHLPKHFLKSFVYYNARHSGAGLFLFFETYRSISLRRLYHTFPFLTNAFLENSAVRISNLKFLPPRPVESLHFHFLIFRGRASVLYGSRR